MIMERARNIKHGMNKNCPLTKIDLEMGFLKLNMQMSWHGMMHLINAIYYKQRNKERDNASGKLRSSRNYGDRNTQSQVQHVRGFTCKMHHHQNNACSFNKMNSTIIFLKFFYPKTIYD